jgi:NAD(P)-dependent dehydrogenase (short-subunit alcohol dehydrogenase family)
MAKNKYCAVVTGGTRGIGYSIAERFIQDGIDVIVTGTGTKNASNYPIGADFYQVDFLNDSSVKDFIKHLKQKPIDILINNAGINKIGEFEKIDAADFDNIQKVNLKTPFLLCQAVIPYMKKNNWGRIVNITSIWGNVTKEYRASYSSSKFALDGMTVALAAEVASMGILANSVAPGFIDTDLTRKVLGDKGMQEIKNIIPIKRLGKPNEVASFISFLVSEENTYISGQNIMIDGGFSRV